MTDATLTTDGWVSNLPIPDHGGYRVGTGEAARGSNGQRRAAHRVASLRLGRPAPAHGPAPQWKAGVCAAGWWGGVGVNLRIAGYHAAADWLLYKIRSAKGAVALHLEDDDTLTTRPARLCKAQESLVGVYRKDVRYTDMLDDLRAIAANLPKRGRNGGRRTA